MRKEWKASDYASNSKGQAIWAQELIEKIELQGDESILDIGCGDGKNHGCPKPTHKRRSGRHRF